MNQRTEPEPESESWFETAARGAVIAIVALVIIVVGVRVLAKVDGNFQDRPNPPAACQLLGGSWSWWSGWSCG